jgi:arsenate reductase-like glutaredoxin family protein
MKIIKVTREYFETEEEKVYFFEPLEKVPSVEELQKIADTNEVVVRQIKGSKEELISVANALDKDRLWRNR